MSKIKNPEKVFDLSDYIRPLSKYFIKNTSQYSCINAIRITTAFIIIGLLGSYFIYSNNIYLAAIFIQLKNFLDASDGEWARQNNRPSFVGRYYDSIGDFICNISMHYAIYCVTDASLTILLIAILVSHLQVSIYVYFNLLYRNQCQKKTVSRLLEYEKPKGYSYDNQKLLTIFHFLFLIIYVWQDYIVQLIDSKSNKKKISKKYLSFVSLIGGGTQLLLTTLLLVLDCIHLYWFVNIGALSVIAILILLYRIFQKNNLQIKKLILTRTPN